MTDTNLVPNMTMANEFVPRLLADIGGTNARFALEVQPQCFEAVSVLACDAYPDLYSALQAYLQTEMVRSCLMMNMGVIAHAAIAIANPVEGDVVRMTNHHWTFSIEALRCAMHWQTLLVVNDFSALAMALPYLSEDERVQIGGGTAQAQRVIGLIGPGTGLGVSGIIPAGQRWIPLCSEGGHVTFSPVNATELALLELIWAEFPHVSAERLISGMGLELMYRTLARASIAGDSEASVDDLNAADITRRAIEGRCVICAETVAHFCAMLGTIAGNLALTLGATGGIYIGGGIVPRLGELFAVSEFRQRFEAKGRFGEYLAQIPTYLITARYPAFVGVSAILSAHLSGAGEVV